MNLELGLLIGIGCALAYVGTKLEEMLLVMQEIRRQLAAMEPPPDY